MVAVGLGALHAWADRHTMNPDGISYLDLADAVRTGRWSDAVSAYWSLVYPCLLAVGLMLSRVEPYWEATVAHAVNFSIYLCALASFHFLWVGLWHRGLSRARAAPADAGERLPSWAWLVLGYALFIWTSLDLITLRIVTPDMCVAACVYLAAGILVHLQRGQAGTGWFALLGLVLGIGYLTKAIMLPMAVVFAVVALFAAGRFRRLPARVVVVLICFALPAGPYVTFLSIQKGRLTFGDSGRINYAAHVSGIYPWDHWRGLPLGTGTPVHPSRQILDKPAVFEFASPVPGTYPLWYDPSYWYDGVKPTFSLSRQASALWRNKDVYFDLLCRQQGAWLFPVLVLFAFGSRLGSALREILSYWPLLLPALAGLGIYALVHVEPRYAAPFVLLGWGVLLPAVRLPAGKLSGSLIRAACGVSALALLLTIAVEAGPAVNRTAADLRTRTDTAPHQQWQIARQLQEMGLRPGDKVAHIGQALKSWSYWARLAGVQIISELRPAESFWLSDDATRARVIEAFRSTGARAVIAHRPPSDERPWGLPIEFAPGFQPLGNTGHYVLFLAPLATQTSSAPG
ncbi:MAG: hypothetical protein ACUVXJ_05795 [Phycisphaerae bacterium]